MLAIITFHYTIHYFFHPVPPKYNTVEEYVFDPLSSTWCLVAPPQSSGSVLDHISLPPVFESRRGDIWRLFHIWLHFITFGGRSAHLANRVHKSAEIPPRSKRQCVYLLRLVEFISAMPYVYQVTRVGIELRKALLPWATVSLGHCFSHSWRESIATSLYNRSKRWNILQT